MWCTIAHAENPPNSVKQEIVVTRNFALLAVLICLPSSAWAMSLDEAIKATLRTNPDILASQHNLEAAEELYKQARGSYFPSVDIVLAGGHESSNNTTTRAAGLPDLSLTRKERSIKLTQLLFDGYGRSSLVAQQEALVGSAMARLASSEENTSLRAVQVYLEVLRRGEVVDLAAENLRHHDSTLRKIQERFESGVGTKVDVVQTQGRRAQSQGNLLLAERDAKNGVAEFNRVIGVNPSNLNRPPVVSGLPDTLDAALEVAYRNSPQLQAAQADLEAAVAAHKQAEGSFYPRLDLELGATRNDDTDGTIGGNDDETAVVRLSYNVFRGGADKARLNEAQAREFAARETVRSIRRAVTEDVTLIWNELQDILQRLEYLQAHVKSTEEVLVVYNEQLSLGKRTLLDLLDVQNELLRAKVAYSSGEYTAMLARYRVLTSTGKLLESLGVSR
jgi:adhesin transport system outer membrane protein